MRNLASEMYRQMSPKQLLAVVLTGLLLAGCPPPPVLNPPPHPQEVHWLRFAHITDFQVVDEESPARLVRLDPLVGPSWRPQEAYNLHTLDATIRVLNGLHAQGASQGRPLDFVIATGDITDGAQHNELRWVIDTMDGGWVVPDSGELDGPLRDVAPEDNPKLGFQAIGLDPEIPWYTVFGNHDGLAVGTFAVDRSALDATDWSAPLFGILAQVLGLHALDPNLNSLFPTGGNSPAILRASQEFIDPLTLQLSLNQLTAGPIVDDPARHFSSREMFIEAHFNTTKEPPGHGFNEANRSTGLPRYSVRPKQEVPLRIIVLDTVAMDPPLLWPVHYGVMTREQFEFFLKPEIEAARTAGEFVILASHHPSADFDLPYTLPTVGTAEFRRYIASQPNILAHICGHTHRHLVTPVQGLHPYLEIETASLIAYPQEGRVFDVFYIEETNSFRLTSTMISHASNPTRLSLESYRRAVIDHEFGKRATQAPPWPELQDLFSDPEGVLGPETALAAYDPAEMTLSPEERYGRPEDRQFSIILHRP